MIIYDNNLDKATRTAFETINQEDCLMYEIRHFFGRLRKQLRRLLALSHPRKHTVNSEYQSVIAPILVGSPEAEDDEP